MVTHKKVVCLRTAFLYKRYFYTTFLMPKSLHIHLLGSMLHRKGPHRTGFYNL